MAKKPKPDYWGYRLVDGKMYRVEAFIDFTKLFNKMVSRAASSRSKQAKMAFGAIRIVVKPKEASDGR